MMQRAKQEQFAKFQPSAKTFLNPRSHLKFLNLKRANMVKSEFLFSLNKTTESPNLCWLTLCKGR